MAFHRELAVLTPLNMASAIRSPTDSWVAATMYRSQMTSPTPNDQQVNGARVTSPTPDGRPTRQDKKRLSLAFLTKGSFMGDPEQDKQNKTDKQATDDNDTSSISTSTGSASKETSRNRASLSLPHAGPGTPLSPPPEALPAFQRPSVGQPNASQTSIQRQLSGRRPDTSKSVKSGKSETSRTDSVKKRLSFMNISKKSSKSSVRGRAHDTLVEE